MKFKMCKADPCDKSFDIYNDKIVLSVDYDDVDHPAVLKEAKRVLKILNTHEDLEEKYADILFRMNGLEK